MAFDWKDTLPLLILFFVLALLNWAGIGMTGFVGAILIAAFWFFMVPILSALKFDKAVDGWFKKAGIWALFAASFALISGTFISTGTYAWATWLVQIGYILSWIFALIGSIIALGKA